MPGRDQPDKAPGAPAFSAHTPMMQPSVAKR
jgi:hypothetical protein